MKGVTYTNKKEKIIVAAAIALAATFVLIQVGISLVTSNSVPVTVHPQQSLTLSVNDNDIFSGDTVILTATLSEGTPDQSVTFLQDGSSIGSVISVGGVATKQVTLNNPGQTDIVYVFTATIV